MLREFFEKSIEYFSGMGMAGLGILAFVESSFFPVPPDLLLIAMSLNTPEKALLFALICTTFSTLGGALGYAIGKFGGRPVFYKFFSKKIHYLEKVENMYKKYGLWAVFLAAFTPIPYKVFTIASGIFAFNFIFFILASFIGRGTRFFIIGISLMFLGDKVKDYLEFLILGAILALALLVWAYYRRKKSVSTVDIRKQKIIEDK